MNQACDRPSRRRAWALLGLAVFSQVAQADEPATTAAPGSADCNAPSLSTLLLPPPGDAAELLPPQADAYWLSHELMKWPGADAEASFRLYASANGQLRRENGLIQGAELSVQLAKFTGALPAGLTQRFRFVGDGVVLHVGGPDRAKLPGMLRGQVWLAQLDRDDRVEQVTQLQIAGALDDLYPEAAGIATLGASPGSGASRFNVWAPTARQVAVCVFASANAAAGEPVAMRRDARTGAWTAELSGNLAGKYYQYLVEVFVPGIGVLRNRVTDPYSLSLSADSRRSYIADLDAAALKPPGWDTTPMPAALATQTDMVIYELHVRDFSINDTSVPSAQRGKYLAFTESGSQGMRHLHALAAAGLTDVHLLPVFDFASVPETGCTTPSPGGAAGSESQQATISASAAGDCFNWGYDPWHFTAPEGSYASDAGDGAVRIVEFRRMVQALHQAGLRVGMDVVYNHTTASGQTDRSVLDRIVPGYYQRLDAHGAVEHSTCCENTATENMMMAKLMIDSAETWTRQYRIDSFRFDLMGHQPRAVMEQLGLRVDRAAGRHVNLIGEGWNFGEVADGARFVQASQLSLPGSGIGSFSDRARDAIRGGRASDSGTAMLANQGFVTGLSDAANASATARREELLQAADLVRVGLAGSIRDFPLTTWNDQHRTLQQIRYGEQPAGYAAAPGEVVNYVENHDNQTLFDIGVLKLPTATSREDRARVQVLALALTAFSQGVAYFHAGVDTLRSKSLDRNSFDSGDWFNRIDWSYQDNYFGNGLPPRQDNGKDYPLLAPLLADAGIKPGPAEIAFARDAFRDLLRIRASSTLFRLADATQVKRRLSFPNSGSGQNPVVIAGHLDGRELPGANFRELLYLVNVDPSPQSVTLSTEIGKHYRLHPVQRARSAADKRPTTQASYESTTGRFLVPARTALVYVVGGR